MSRDLLMNKQKNLDAILEFSEEIKNIEDSPGFKLRVAREAAGVNIGVLAASLKVPVSKLEALESDDFSALPDEVFARALASSVCRALGLDALSVLKLMPKNNASSFSVITPRINVSFKDGLKKTRSNSLLSHFSRPVGISVMILLLGALGVGFLPLDKLLPIIKNDTVEIVDTTSAVTSPMPVMVASSEVVADMTAAPIVADTVVAELIGVSPDTAQPISSAPLELRARGQSWVQVRDATKAVIFEQTLAKDESTFVTGLLPFMVVIGRADVTEVLVRGKVFELDSVAKDNVARFEVKQ